MLGVLLPQPEVHAIETAASLMLLFEGLAEDCPALGFAAKEDGLARLLALGHLAEQDVSGQMDEAATMLQLVGEWVSAFPFFLWVFYYVWGLPGKTD